MRMVIQSRTPTITLSVPASASSKRAGSRARQAAHR